MAASASFGGFAEGLADALAELEAGLVDPGDVDDDLGALFAAYRLECERLGTGDSRPCGGGLQSSSRPISEHGTRPPSWSTASRT